MARRRLNVEARFNDERTKVGWGIKYSQAFEWCDLLSLLTYIYGEAGVNGSRVWCMTAGSEPMELIVTGMQDF